MGFKMEYSAIRYGVGFRHVFIARVFRWVYLKTQW